MSVPCGHYNVLTMTDASFQEYELYCPVCNAHFKQLVVLHKLPKGFQIEPYLAGMVESHDHAAYQAWQAKLREESETKVKDKEVP